MVAHQDQQALRLVEHEGLAVAFADRKLRHVPHSTDVVEIAKEDLSEGALADFWSNFEVVSVEFLN